MDRSSTPSKAMPSRPRRAGFTQVHWFRRREFLAAFLVFVGLYAAFLLPASGPQLPMGWVRITAFVLLSIAWTALVLIDGQKPVWMRNSAALGLVFVLGWLFYRYSGAQWDRLGHMFFNLELMNRGNPQANGGDSGWKMLIDGAIVSLRIFFYAAVLATLLGLTLAVLRTFNNKILGTFIVVYIDLVRALPVIVQIIMIYFGLPFLGITLSPLVSGILALTLNNAAFMSEIFRAGLEAVHHGQTEAARALGLSAFQSMRLVILPQALRTVVPPYTGSLVGLLKETALCSTISILELLNTARLLQTWFANATPLAMAALLYLAILLPLTRASSELERRWNKAR